MSLVGLNSLESLFLPKIAKGVEGGGDLSVRTLVFDDSNKAIRRSWAAQTLLAKTMALLRSRREPISMDLAGIGPAPKRKIFRNSSEDVGAPPPRQSF